MKRIRIILALLIVVGLFYGCSKSNDDLSSSFSENVRFYFKANINGLPVNIDAGGGGYFLDTDYSYGDSIVSMKGRLSTGGTSPKNTFELVIRSKDILTSLDVFNPYRTIQKGYLPLRDASYYKKVPNRYDMTFYPDSGVTATYYTWSFSDGNATGSNVSRQVDTIDFPRYKATLQTQLGGCSSTTTKVINLYNECDAELSLNFISPLVAEASISAKSGLITEVKWFVNGVESYNGEITTASFPSPGVYEVSAEITFSDGCSQRISKTVSLSGTFIPICDSQFLYTKTAVTEYDIDQKGTIELVYYDAIGTRYTSNYPNTQGSFEIKNVGIYSANDKGQETTRFSFLANAILKDSSGNSIQLKDAFGTFAVAHP